MDRLAKIEKLLHERTRSVAAVTQFLETPRKYTEDENLYMREVHFLVEINMDHGLTMSELADRLNVTRGAVTQMVIKLEKKGYVIRTKGIEDKRMTTLTLTEKGKKTCQDHIIYDRETHLWISQELSEFSDEELERFIHFEKVMRELYTKPRP